MQTVILCGGLGTRLREETEYRPKPMVHIGTKPIIWHIMKTFSHYGHKEFVLTLGYKGDMIKDYFLRYEVMNNDVTVELGKPEAVCMHNCHDETGWKITLANTGEQTLKGGRLKRVEKYIEGDTFMATYGDGVSDVNIDKLIEFHRHHGKLATVTGVNPIARFGELKMSGDRVTSFLEKPQVADGGLISGGFFVFNRKLFDYLSFEESCDLEYGALETIAAQGELMVYVHRGFWYCMDTLRDVERLDAMWKKNQAPWKVW
jgi:glucose-1-phosphate cytidylyltransferase